jgi:hypothetical protein
MIILFEITTNNYSFIDSIITIESISLNKRIGGYKMKEYLQVANQPLMWLMVAPAIFIVLLQAFLISKKAVENANLVGLTKEEVKSAVKIGFVSGIGPALAVFVVMLAMVAVLGGPITWLRTVIIGAASTELAAATIGAEAMGVEFGGEGYGITEYANSVLTMVLNGSAWLVICALLTDKLDMLSKKVSGGDVKVMGVIGGAAMAAAFSYLVSGHLIAGGARLLTAVVSGVVMIGLIFIIKKFPKLEEHSLGIAMIIGMACGAAYVL